MKMYDVIFGVHEFLVVDRVVEISMLGTSHNCGDIY